MNQINKSILIVEDDMFVTDIYKTKLEKEGYLVLASENGAEGLKKLDSAKELPDLILLDIVMPYMDGLTFLQKIRENDRFKKIPVILLTNLSQKEEIQKGFDLGAQDYLIKSHFTPSEVMEKIQKFL